MYRRHARLWAIIGIVPIVSKSCMSKSGELALQEISRRKAILKNRIDIAIEKQVVALAINNPALGQVRVCN